MVKVEEAVPGADSTEVWEESWLDGVQVTTEELYNYWQSHGETLLTFHLTVNEEG